MCKGVKKCIEKRRVASTAFRCKLYVRFCRVPLLFPFLKVPKREEYRFAQLEYRSKVPYAVFYLTFRKLVAFCSNNGKGQIAPDKKVIHFGVVSRRLVPYINEKKHMAKHFFVQQIVVYKKRPILFFLPTHSGKAVARPGRSEKIPR